MKTLVIVAHPNLQQSQVNRRWAEAIEGQPDVTVHRLYDLYPDWTFDLERERGLLLAHDRIVLQFPLYWYSTPPLLKKWLDDVLTVDWLMKLQGPVFAAKELMLAVSAGGTNEVYQAAGLNHYTLSELLRPLQAVSNAIGTTFLPTYAFMGVAKLAADGHALNESAEAFVRHALKRDFRAPRVIRGTYE